MENEKDLEQALQELTSGPVEIFEGGRRIPGASRVQSEVHRRGGTTLVHLWSDEQNLVRRVVQVAERGEGRLVLEVARLGRRHPDRLEIIAAGSERAPQRDRKSTRLNSSHSRASRMPSSA